jgi:ribonucleotide monophosphatase NagD (HAD superfamily)
MQTILSRNALHKISHKIVKLLMLTNRPTNRQRDRHAEINDLRFTTYGCENAKHWKINY